VKDYLFTPNILLYDCIFGAGMNDGHDLTILSLEEDQFIFDNPDDTTSSSGANYWYLFRALKAGKTQIHFLNGRFEGREAVVSVNIE
jgi:hypothetical protein